MGRERTILDGEARDGRAAHWAEKNIHAGIGLGKTPCRPMDSKEVNEAVQQESRGPECSDEARGPPHTDCPDAPGCTLSEQEGWAVLWGEKGHNPLGGCVSDEGQGQSRAVRYKATAIIQGRNDPWL